jgi:plastocyanin
VAGDAADAFLVGFVLGLVYNPASFTIKVGGSVRWVNSSGISHTATSN